jgi:hypothetical protein
MPPNKLVNSSSEKLELAKWELGRSSWSKVVILSSVSSAERDSPPKTSQGNALGADDNADEILMADDIDGKADDIFNG